MPPSDQQDPAVAPLKLTKEDLRKLVDVFRILERWKRENDEKAAERAK